MSDNKIKALLLKNEDGTQYVGFHRQDRTERWYEVNTTLRSLRTANSIIHIVTTREFTHTFLDNGISFMWIWREIR